MKYFNIYMHKLMINLKKKLDANFLNSLVVESGFIKFSVI